MIKICELNKSYGKKRVIQDVSIELDTDTYGLLGPNGAGKTTLLRLLSGILSANSGKIIEDRRRECIGYLPQKFGCFPELTAYDQLDYFACLKKLPANQHKEEILRVLKIVNLEDKQKEKCRKLSGGMVRRMGIAQALLGKPSLLLLDEPTVGLDPEERNNFNNIIRGLEKTATIVLSTHLVEDVKYLCKKVIVMDKGKVCKIGTGEEIANVASGRVCEKRETELGNIKGEYYIERYVEKQGERFVRIITKEKLNEREESCCTPDIEDGYLAALKWKADYE